MKTCIILLLLAAGLLADEPPPPLLKVTVTLVQLDAVVTDRAGKHVSNLTKDDFRIYQDEALQKITHFSYVPGLAPVREGVATPSAPTGVRVKPRPGQTQRTVVLLVDDLGLSFASTHNVREALRKYINEQIVPGDLVAVLRTSGGSGAFQQFTTDPRVLNAAVARVSWSLVSRTGTSSQPAWGGGDDEAGSVYQKNHRSSMGTLATLRYVIEGLRALPGRKSVVVFSDGLIFRKPKADLRPVIGDRLHQLIDAANRAGVVIYTIDARGLKFNGLQAQDNVNGSEYSTDGTPGGSMLNAINRRTEELTDSWDGMIELAHDTGGLFFKNTNDLATATRQAVEDLSGYYLIGYTPSSDSFRPINGRTKYHRTALKVLKPGLRVRTRTGYFGAPDEAPPPAPAADPARQLLDAVLSPFNSGGVTLHLSALFGNAAEAGSYITAMLHIAGSDLTFTEEPDGTHKAQVDVASFIYGDDGAVVDKRAQAYTIRASKAEFETARRWGFLYSLQHLTKKPGAYQVRAAVRDSGSGRIGSASQFLEVPNVEKGALALSSITMRSRDDGASALRVFHPGEPLYYGFLVYNPALLPTTGKPDVEIRARVFKDGQPVWTGPAFNLASATPADPRRVKVAQQFAFSASTPPGEYFLEVVATSGKRRVSAIQWMDFELRPAN